MGSELKEEAPVNPNELPFAAPCAELPMSAPMEWIHKGWSDIKAAPRQSLSYGVIIVLLSYTVIGLTWWMGKLGLFLGLVTGFVFLGPLLALNLYSISIQVERKQQVSLTQSFRDAKNQISGAMVFSGILTVVFLVWIRAATGLHIFFPEASNYEWRELVWFLGIGSTVGAMFSAIVFAVSVFSLPMLMDRQADTVTAVVTSVNAVLRNKSVMVLWAFIIGGCVLLGVATAFLSWIVLLPLLGHAAWHSYRDTIDASMWPKTGEISHTD